MQFLYIFHAIFIRYTRLRRQKSICVLNFDEIPQSTAEIKLLPVSDDGWPPYWNFTFHFDLQCMCNYPHVMLHPPAKYRRNRTNIGGLVTSYRFSKMAAVSHAGFCSGYIRPRTKCNCRSQLRLHISLHRIYSFGDTAILLLD